MSTQRRPDVCLKLFDCFIEWHMHPAMFCLFEESPVELAKNLGAKIGFRSAFVQQLPTLRFHCLNDSLKLLVSGVVETSFVSSQRKVIEIGCDNWGGKEGIRRNWWRKQVNFHDKLSCMCSKWRHRTDKKQKEDCLRVSEEKTRDGNVDSPEQMGKTEISVCA